MNGTMIQRMRCGKDHKTLYAIPAEAAVEWQGVCQWISVDGQPLRCTVEGCRRQMRAFQVYGKHSDKIKCGDRCVAAIGPACECQCGGENHGGNSWS